MDNAKSYPKLTLYQRIGFAILAVLLNAILLMLPSILLGLPFLVLEDRRLASFLLIMSLWIILECSASYQPIAQETPQSSGGRLASLMSAAILTVFLSSLSEEAITGASPFTLAATLGCLAMLVGISLRYLAIRTLGSYFFDEVIVVSGQPLVTTGIYQYIRHPSELGNLCLAFGCAFLLGSLSGLLLSSLLFLPIVLIRIQLEDSLLSNHYPDQFPAYARDVPALFLWRLPKKSK